MEEKKQVQKVTPTSTLALQHTHTPNHEHKWTDQTHLKKLERKTRMQPLSGIVCSKKNYQLRQGIFFFFFRDKANKIQHRVCVEILFASDWKGRRKKINKFKILLFGCFYMGERDCSLLLLLFLFLFYKKDYRLQPRCAGLNERVPISSYIQKLSPQEAELFDKHVALLS